MTLKTPAEMRAGETYEDISSILVMALYKLIDIILGIFKNLFCVVPYPSIPALPGVLAYIHKLPHKFLHEYNMLVIGRQ